MIASDPVISVIIPTRDARSVLQHTLAALAVQTFPADQYEVIVVGGVDPDAIRRLAPVDLPCQLRIFEERGAGAGRRRNKGASEARGRLLVFLDDDMVAQPGFLAACWQAHLNGKDDRRVVMGYSPIQLHAQRSSKQFGWSETDMRSWWEDTFHAMALPEHRFAYTDLLSNNFSIWATFFHAVGGFDPDFICHEDYELGARLLQNDAEFAYCIDARAYHYDERDLTGSMQRKWAEGKADIQFARKHPDFTRLLPFSGQITELKLPSRLLRALGDRWPSVANLMVNGLLYLLILCERLKLRTLWQRLRAGLFAHYYWKGVLSEAQSWNEIRSLVAIPLGQPEGQIDLAAGIESSIKLLDQERFSGVRVLWNGLPLGTLPVYPGAEPVRSRHLLAWLGGGGALVYARLLALSDALGDISADLRQEVQAGACVERVDLCLYYPGVWLPPTVWVDRLQPSEVGEIELSKGRQSLAALLGSQDRRQIVVRWCSQPIGWLHLVPQDRPRTTSDLVYELLAQIDHGLFLAAIRTPKRGHQSAEISAQHVSVIICTRDRTDNLHGCLVALQRQKIVPREVIVVDNAPSDDSTMHLAAQFGVRYVCEDRPGLDFARNRGLQEAGGQIVAYIDDDARADANWLAALVQSFGEHSVDAVTGLVAPAELATTDQCLFEWVYGGMGHGFQRRLFRRDFLDSWQLLWASGCGVGANMAFRRQVLIDLGGFDPALDVGGPARGGGDVEMYHRLLVKGYSLLYEPAVLVWHYHRRTRGALRRQLSDNGCSFGVYLLTCIANRSVSAGRVVAFGLIDWLWSWVLWRLWHPGWMPRSLVLAELHGALISPAAYIQAVRRAKKLQA